MALIETLKNNPAGCTLLVVGAAKSGFATLRLLHRMGVRVILSERGPESSLDPVLLDWLRTNGVRFETGGHSRELFQAADGIVVSPGVPLDMPELVAARAAGCEIIGELGLGVAFLAIPVVAITGTNGKTTVTQLIHDLLVFAGRKVFLGGNIGTPLTEYLQGEQDAEVAVLEVSSFQLDTAGDFRPAVAVLLNISPDHLDRYPSYEEYAASKMSIFRNQQATDAAVLNSDDEETLRNLRTFPVLARQFWFSGTTEPVNGAGPGGQDDEITLTGDFAGESYRLPESLAKSPNRENAMAAVLATRLLKCPPEAVQDGLLRFQRAPHRLTAVAEIDGVVYIDDSKATNIGAVKSALDGMNRPVILIAGGRDKGGDYRYLADAIRARVKAMVLIGEAREKMAHSLAGLAPITMAENLAEAVATAARSASPGDVVLLSPACASFDMFRSYADRGEKFQQEVRRLAETRTRIVGK
ncbi:MAG: UDP-N-acetylmuramoyl-L-alanine--D-glutamate ligase [Thermodesulfobacteriota bacterium]